MNKKNFFAALVAVLIFFNVILSENVLAWGGPQLDKDGYYTLTELSYGQGDYSIIYREYDLVRLVKQANGTYKYYNYGETVRLKTLSLDRGSCLNSRYDKPKKIIIPEGVEAIMDGSFENKGLTDVKFPKSLQYIGSSAFQGNKISGKISLPNVWKVDSYAFEGNKITGIDAPKLELIDTNAFQNNMIEGEVNLPELKAISWNGLENNKEISLIAPKLEVVGRDAFLNTTVKKAELPKLKLVEGQQGGADSIKKYYTIKQFTVEWKAEGKAKLPERKPVVKVHLYANGEQKKNYVEVSNGAQTAEFKDLPTYYIDQTEFKYTAKEAFNDLIIQKGETFEYESEGVKYTFKVNYEGDKIINTVVKSEDPKREEAKKAAEKAKADAEAAKKAAEEAKAAADQAKAEAEKKVKEAEEAKKAAEAEQDAAKKAEAEKKAAEAAKKAAEEAKKAEQAAKAAAEKAAAEAEAEKAKQAAAEKAAAAEQDADEKAKLEKEAKEAKEAAEKAEQKKQAAEEAKKAAEEAQKEAEQKAKEAEQKAKEKALLATKEDKNAAKGEIDKLPNLSEDEKKKAEDAVDKAKTKGDVAKAVEDAKEKAGVPTPAPTPAPKPEPKPSYPGYGYNPFWNIYFGSGTATTNKTVEPQKEVVMKLQTRLVIDSKNLVVTVNGVQKEVVMDVEPFVSNNRTMLPIRFVAEALGFEVEWDNANRTVILKDKDTLVKIPVDTNQIIVNGTVFKSDVKPIFKNNRTILPIANIARALGLVDGKDIIWNGTTKEVIIKRDIVK